MKKFRERCGAALLEVLISIAMMGLLMVPISSGILMSLQKMVDAGLVTL